LSSRSRGFYGAAQSAELRRMHESMENARIAQASIQYYWQLERENVKADNVDRWIDSLGVWGTCEREY